MFPRGCVEKGDPLWKATFFTPFWPYPIRCSNGSDIKRSSAIGFTIRQRWAGIRSHCRFLFRPSHMYCRSLCYVCLGQGVYYCFEIFEICLLFDYGENGKELGSGSVALSSNSCIRRGGSRCLQTRTLLKVNLGFSEGTAIPCPMRKTKNIVPQPDSLEKC